MTGYIIDKKTKEIVDGYKELSRANYVLTDCYSPHPNNTKSVLTKEQALDFHNKNIADIKIKKFENWIDVPLRSW